MTDWNWNESFFETFRPTSEQIETLIAAAQKHTYGIEFLLEGDLCSVATTFGVHAFTVEAARDYWKQLSN